MEKTVAYKCDCGKKYHTKKSAATHEKNCRCWTNPKYKTCKTCVFGRQIKDSNGMEHEPQYLQTWKQWGCSNPEFVYDLHFTPAHEKADDLCINCPVWKPNPHKARNRTLTLKKIVMSNDNQTHKGEEQEKAGKRKYVLFDVQDFAEWVSSIDTNNFHKSPGRLINRIIENLPLFASPTPAEEKGADYWNKLRDKFFKECTKMDSVDGCMIKIDYAPHDLFEWFKRQFAATAPQQEAAQGKEVEFDENKAEEFICSQNFTSSKMDIDNILFTGDRVKKLLVLFNNHLFKSQL